MKKEYERPIAELTSFDLEDRITSESGEIDNPFEASESFGKDPFD